MGTGVKFVGQPVEKVETEGALDHMLGVSIDEHQGSMIFLDSIRDENDVFERCPVIGQIDTTKELDGKSIKDVLKETPHLRREVLLNPTGKELVDYDSGPTVDKFAVSDAKWMRDDAPEELVWKSALLAQLQAKKNAIEHFLADAAAVNFSGKMTEEDRKLVAQRARQLAAELQDAALNEIRANLDTSLEKHREGWKNTKEQWKKYVVKDKEAIEKGGLKEEEVDKFFPEEGL